MHETYFLQNWLPRSNQRLTQLRFNGWWAGGWWWITVAPRNLFFEGFRVSWHRLYQGVITLLELTLSSVDI